MVTQREGGKLMLLEVVKHVRCNRIVMGNLPRRPRRNSQSIWDLRMAETSFKGMQY